MRLLRIAVFTAYVFVVFPLLAQTTPSANSQSPKASQASPAPETSQGSQTGFIRNPFVLPPQTKSDNQTFGPMPRLMVQRRDLDRKQLAQRRATGDPGIFAQVPANMCLAIISYNFSQTADPRLESVTTCTPSDKVTVRRAQGDQTKPLTPQQMLKLVK